MFWRRKLEEKGKQKKRPVKEIVPAMCVHMAKRHGLTLDILRNLRLVECNGVVGDKPVIMIRVFDPAAADKKGVAIEDYESLDGYPKLVLYAGYYRSVLGIATDIHIEKK